MVRWLGLGLGLGLGLVAEQCKSSGTHTDNKILPNRKYGFKFERDKHLNYIAF